MADFPKAGRWSDNFFGAPVHPDFAVESVKTRIETRVNLLLTKVVKLTPINF